MATLYEALKKAESRFWTKVSKDGPVPTHAPWLGPCWVWMASKFKRGYGQFKVQRVNMHSHRAAQMLAYGIIPRDMCVLHRCDNAACVRPEHLFLGTVVDNNADMCRKGRHRFVTPATRACGEAHGRSKLTVSDVVLIRDLLDSGATRQSVAERYGVSSAAIRKIELGETWRHA